MKQQQIRVEWQHYLRSKRVLISTTLTIFLVLMSALLIVMHIQPLQKTSPTPPYNADVEHNIDEIVTQVLVDENTHGWDEHYHGILINWRRDDTSKVNCGPDRCDIKGYTTRHDEANDIRDLENLYWYKSRHPGDTSMDGYITRVQPIVKQRWGNTTLDKGWLYYLLLHLATYSDNSLYWNHVIEHWAATQYTTIDPRLGIHHSKVDTVAGPGSITLQDAYRVDHNLELGLALVDAGTRYHHPEWIAAGQKEVAIVTQQAFSRTYHLFDRIYLLYDPRYGSNKVIDYQARMGEIGQEVEALIKTGMYTNTMAYLTLAREMLEALLSSPLHDPTYGGFHFKMYLGTDTHHTAGEIDSTLKETRQLHLLTALHFANHVFGNQWKTLETEMLSLATTPHKLFLPAPVPGFTYNLRTNWALYSCSTCAPEPTQNWDSAEADNIALEALQTTLDPNWT